MEDAGWQFGAKLTTEHVWDAFVILSLLRDHDRRDLCMQVLHTGLQKDRFTSLMEERNIQIISEGQDEVSHYCQKCLRLYNGPGGQLGKLKVLHYFSHTIFDAIGAEKCQAIVSDGITLGHACCAVFRCTTPLLNNKDRFCPVHDDLHKLCAITGCQQPAMEDRKACALPEHQEMERMHTEKGKAAFTLTERLQRHRVNHPNDTLTPNGDTDDLEENMQWFEVNQDSQISLITAPNPGSVGTVDDIPDPCDSKSPTGNRKLKACFGRRRTHNEQTLVRPCGVIHARATFYGAEAVSNVLVRIVLIIIN
jgi:hypothetical protein